MLDECRISQKAPPTEDTQAASGQDLVLASLLTGGQLLLIGNEDSRIVAHVEGNIHLPEANAMLALHNASLLAQTMGLGSFLVGYLVGACGPDRSIPDFLGVPRTHRAHGALALGCPEQTFSRWPKRKPPKVTWR